LAVIAILCTDRSAFLDLDVPSHTGTASVFILLAISIIIEWNWVRTLTKREGLIDAQESCRNLVVADRKILQPMRDPSEGQ
jgi:hypothetical protein